MTLLELLVKEFPGRGGWPEGYNTIATDGYKPVWAYASNGRIAGLHMHFHCNEHGCVTREQYEDAIAAQQPVWNGEGLPPIGLLVELMDDSQSQTWGDATIKFYGDSFAVWDDHGEECSNSLCHVKVRPIRTEEERKREASIAAMREFFGHASGLYNLSGLYEEIASGKIPGLRLSDG